MTLHFDHAIIAVHDLDAATQDYRALGFTVMPGGVHANRATRNALIAFPDGTYLELLAATGDPPLPDLIDFSVLLQGGEGLVGYALRSNDLEADIARLRARGFAVGEIVPGERRRTDGMMVRWKLALLDGGFAPFLIQDVTPRDRRISRDRVATTHANRALGVRGVEIAVREMAAAWDRYTRLFGLSPEPGDGSRRSIGCVALREAITTTESESDETLVALHLVFERGADERLARASTHGVRFRQFAPVG